MTTANPEGRVTPKKSLAHVLACGRNVEHFFEKRHRVFLHAWTHGLLLPASAPPFASLLPSEWRRNFLQQNIEHPDPTPPNDEIDIKQEPEDEELSDQMDFDPGPPAFEPPIVLAPPNGMIGLHPPPLWPMEFPQPPPFPQPMGFLPPMGIPPPMQFVPLFANPPPPIPYPPARNPYPPQPLPQPVPMHPHPRPLFGAFPAPPLNPNPHGYAPIAPHGQNGAFRQQIGHQPRWRDRFRPPTPGVVRLPPPPEPPNLRRWHDRHDEPPPPGVGA
ncbi:hypothetical protein niasHS_006982 [Heterodera schachtii]|uniref:Uncharacterized protein n=1 Tax=Heterodera schachtii TaxID=97005 RepID=A0ABD2JF70_HETSC